MCFPPTLLCSLYRTRLRSLRQRRSRPLSLAAAAAAAAPEEEDEESAGSCSSAVVVVEAAATTENLSPKKRCEIVCDEDKNEENEENSLKGKPFF